VGQDRNSAKNQLEDEDFTVSEVCVDDEDLGNPAPLDVPDVDEVTSQDPPGGSYYNPATTTVTIRYYRPLCP
jgi:hypothetical protein